MQKAPATPRTITPCRKGLNSEKNIQAYLLVAFKRAHTPDQETNHFIKIEWGLFEKKHFKG